MVSEPPQKTSGDFFEKRIIFDVNKVISCCIVLYIVIKNKQYLNFNAENK